MYVLFLGGRVDWLGPAMKGFVALAPALRLPLGSFPWLCLLGRALLKTDFGEVVINSTLCASFAICKTCFPCVRFLLVLTPKAGSRLPL